jgi:hypothetical protein
MALVIQNVAMVESFVPFERPPQALTLWTAIPRGLTSFIVDVRQLNLIAAGDTALLNLTATLPPNFGYVMNDANLTLAMNEAGSEWAPTYNLNLQNFYRAPGLGLALNGNWVQNMVGAAQDDSTKSSSNIQPWPSFPIIGFPGTTGALIVLSTFNNTTDAKAAGTINAYISFWQFDLEQIRKFAINSPSPVHVR